jgi:hypothetical protein
MKRSIITAVLLFSLATTAMAVEDPTKRQESCRKLENILDCTIVDVFAGFTFSDVDEAQIATVRSVLRLSGSRDLLSTISATPATPATPMPPATTTPAQDDPKIAKMEDRAMAVVKKEVQNQNLATTPPPSSDANVHASRENFNVPLSMAITSITRSDKQALIVRFNQADTGPFTFGATATIAQPTVSTDVEKNIKESKRPAAAENLKGMLQDTDDVSLTLSFTPRTPTCDESELARGACYGQTVGAYRNVLSKIMAPLFISIGGTSDLTDKVTLKFLEFVGSLPKRNVTLFRDLTDSQQAALFDLIEANRRLSADDTAREIAARNKLKLDNLAKLIANQPQWVLQLTGQRRDVLVGANKFAADLKYERGIVNLNSVAVGCKTQASKCVTDSLIEEKRLQNHSIVFNLSVKQTDSYSLAALPAGAIELADGETENPADPFFKALDSPRKRTYGAGLQYGFDIQSARVNDVATHLDFAGSWSQESGAKVKNKQTKTVISTTLTIPLGKDISLPVTLSYANHPDLLKDTQKSLGVDFGLTYRLPFTKPE